MEQSSTAPMPRAAHPLSWVRVAVGLAAVGTTLVAVLDVSTGATSLSNRIQQALLALVACSAFAISRRHPRVAGSLVIGSVWLQLVVALATTGEPEPALVVFPVLVVGAGLLLGQRAPGWLAGISAVAIVAGYLAGRHFFRGSALPDPHEATWLLVTILCTVGAGLMTQRALASYGGLLGESEAARTRYLRLFQQAPDGLVELDAAGRIEEANAAAHRLLAGAGHALAGHPFAEVMSRAGMATPLDLSLASPGAPLVVELARAAGPPRFYEISVGDEQAASTPSGRLLVVRDVTERRLLEGRLGHAQRLETVGQLAGGVAHDFNNLLTVIGGNASLLAELPQPEVRGLALEMLEAQERGLTLTRQLLAFARREARRPEPLDLREVVGGISRLLERLLGEQHRLRLDAGAPAPAVADRGQLEQVLVNLVSNARDALPGGGEVEVTVRCLDRREAAALGSGLEAPRQALLQVADGGVGMSPELLARIFEPFFTTKPRDKGTGLGLATVHGIVTQSGGQVAVESRPGRGTRFSVFLPSVEAAPGAVAARGRDAGPG